MEDIQSFFKHKSVFITGGTGFVGKVLVEKLLRCCPDLDKVYLLVRGNEKSSASQRVQELQSKSQVFLRVQEECPKTLSKMVAVDGDVTLSGLGLSQADRMTLVQNVSVVFHVAATVKFNENLGKTGKINVEGTRNVTELAKKILNLKAFVYVSTAYSNCNRKVVNEVVYPSTISPTQFLDILRKHDDEELDRLAPELIGDHPNIYTFTKQIAENYLVQHCKDLPVIISRPAVVTAAWKEPFPGWIDSKMGLTTVMLLISKGLLQALHATLEEAAEAFPVDVAANHLIAAAWDVATRGRNDKVKVLNGVSSPINPLQRKNVTQMCYKALETTPFTNAIRYPACTVTSSKLLYNFLFFIYHYVPALIGDFYFWARGEKSTLVRACQKLYTVLELYEIVLLHENEFSCDNVLKLQERLSARDKETFYLSVEKLDWFDYFLSYSKGVRRWILKKNEDGIPAILRNLKRLYIRSKIIDAVLVATFGTFLWKMEFFQKFQELVF